MVGGQGRGERMAKTCCNLDHPLAVDITNIGRPVASQGRCWGTRHPLKKKPNVKHNHVILPRGSKNILPSSMSDSYNELTQNWKRKTTIRILGVKQLIV